MNYPIEKECYSAEGWRILHLGASAAPQAQIVHHEHLGSTYGLERGRCASVEIENFIKNNVSQRNDAIVIDDKHSEFHLPTPPSVKIGTIVLRSMRSGRRPSL